MMRSNCVPAEMCDFTVIGIDDNGGSVGMHLSRTGNLLAGHSVFSGGKRHYGLVKEYLPPCHRWIDITIPLDDVFRQYEEAASPIVVFASGDPLFFGFATTIRKRMPHASIKVYPVIRTTGTRIVLIPDKNPFNFLENIKTILNNKKTSIA